MESFAFKHLKQTARESENFETFKENIIDTLSAREPSASFDLVDPCTYIDSPIQDIKISDITNAENFQARANMQIRNMKAGIEGSHGVSLGRHIDFPIAVRMTSAGTYDIVDGFHRPVQALVNGDKNIVAFVVGGDKGLTLQDIFNLSTYTQE